MRGGANVNKGAGGIVLVFDAIKGIVEEHIVKITQRVIEILNAAGRTVFIEFASDPDIIIRELISVQDKKLFFLKSYRYLIIMLNVWQDFRRHIILI